MEKKELADFLERWENIQLLFKDKEQAEVHFPLLMEIALTGTDRNSWRASWAADRINEAIPGIAADWIDKMIDELKHTTHNGKKRQYLKLISLYPVPEAAESFLFDYCLDKLTSTTEDVSVRVYSMQILYNISEIEPELKKELMQIIAQEMEYHPTPGILTRGKKLTTRLKKELKRMNPPSQVLI